MGVAFIPAHRKAAGEMAQPRPTSSRAPKFGTHIGRLATVLTTALIYRDLRPSLTFGAPAHMFT